MEDAQYAEAEAMGGVSDLKEEIAEARAVIDAMDEIHLEVLPFGLVQKVSVGMQIV